MRASSDSCTNALGNSQRRPARLCCHDRPTRRPDQRPLQLDIGFHAGGLIKGRCSEAKAARCWTSLRPSGISQRTQRHSLDILKELNEHHLEPRADESELVARIHSYELAYRMQTAAADVVDLDQESSKTKSLYGLDNSLTKDFGRKCLITRRLLEKGVRFVQLYSGGGHIEDTWDGHKDCISNHKLHAGETDQPIAALIHDLKRTGLWEETLLIWGGEFGRTPTSEGIGKPGRDHNIHGFSMWLAGAGVRGGQAIGATDELGFLAVEDVHHGHCHVNRVGPQRPAWIPFQAAALALSHTLNASFRNRLNVSLLHK